MFTGIVEELGTVEQLTDQGDAVRLTVGGPIVTGDVGHGDSIAVNGCCLTVVERDSGAFTADVMRETLVRTALAGLAPGDRVNLERATAVGDRLGGHIVQGHVDGTGRITQRTPSEHWEVVTIELPSELTRYVVEKGSITVDGTSLTVVGIDDDVPAFTVSLIPETLRATTLGIKGVGDPVNLEVDVLAKYVERLLTHKDS
ncbi:riboflavin synthase [Nocardioidaceae bacterium SCSIO 66511]|nr:riboflavin synthase [Nocardioidaceae bacterium SCSIO 66511]